MKRVVAAAQLAAVASLSAFVVMLFANEPESAGAPGNVAADGGAGTDPADAAGDRSAADGEALFRSRCAGCHGPDGGGGIGPRLAGRVAANFPDPDDQVRVVAEGRGGMPAFGRRLSEDEIRAVVEYTRSL